MSCVRRPVQPLVRLVPIVSGSLVLYGADLGDGVRVGEQSVVMKHEHLLPGHRYEGVPSHPVSGSGAA